MSRARYVSVADQPAYLEYASGRARASDYATTYDPRIFEYERYDPGRIYIPPTTPGPYIPVPMPQPPAQPTGGGTAPRGPSALEIQLAALPVAHEGHVISSAYHNALRSAILLLARQLGIDVAGGGLVMTFAPSFFPDGAKPAWQLTLGIAAKPAQGDAASGWMDVHLPDGARIDGMSVIGRRNAGVKDLRIKLLRHALADGQEQFQRVQLIEVVPTAGDPFTATKGVEVPGAAIAITEELRVVDNRQFKYLVSADLSIAEATAIAQINAIQIVCSK